MRSAEAGSFFPTLLSGSNRYALLPLSEELFCRDLDRLWTPLRQERASELVAVVPGQALNFSERVIAWQRVKGRHDLPWQQTRDAYRIWLSEIMLQQTQVATVLPYYASFLERFPTLAALAAAPLESVLELWSGLGYYARARNLHRCAQILVAEHGGEFSPDPRESVRLPGIGRSSAAAISVFAFGRRAAILDGNVKRVLARCFGIESGFATAQDERGMWALAESLLPESGLESYTQGMMDLGSTVCVRRQPACALCPLREICVARRDSRQAELPKRVQRKALPERASSVWLLTDGRRVLLERRPALGIWGGLLSLPERVPGEAVEVFAQRHACRVLASQALAPIVHGFTHFRLTIDVLRCEVEGSAWSAMETGRQWLPVEEIAAAALPAPIKKLLRAVCR